MALVAKQRRSETAFGRRLRALREEQGLTQSALGEAVGMLQSAVARLEAGEREPGWPTVLKLAEALGVEPNDFVEEKPKPRKPGGGGKK